MPYPGVEFFQCYQRNMHAADTLLFDWSQPGINAPLSVPPVDGLDVSTWTAQYKTWSLVQLTQNYLRYFLRYLASDAAYGAGGLLIHCISGWDRTPLFISLLRISLWADRVVHASLSAEELLYLTIGYDWLLFRHVARPVFAPIRRTPPHCASAHSALAASILGRRCAASPLLAAACCAAPNRRNSRSS